MNKEYNVRKGGFIMSGTKFTFEEMERLREHPCIVEVTPGRVCLSKEFKEIIWNGLQHGEDIHHIFKEHAIPSELLGESRIAGIKAMICKEGKSGNGFRDVASLEYKSNGFKSLEKENEILRTQLKYKEQEIEFLKKIVSLEKEGSTR